MTRELVSNVALSTAYARDRESMHIEQATNLGIYRRFTVHGTKQAWPSADVTGRISRDVFLHSPF